MRRGPLCRGRTCYPNRPWLPTPTSRPCPACLYRHYKGGLYEVLDIARHSETLEPLVVYRALYGAHGLWVRPAAMFTETVVIGGVRQPRFVALEDLNENRL